MKNIIQTQLTTAIMTAMDAAIADLEAAVAGKLPVLSEEERSSYGSINEQNKLLVNKVRDYRQNNPAMSAPEVDWTEFEADYQARLFLETRIARLESLIGLMRGAKILHDHDNYQDSLNDYAYSQYRKGASEPGYEAKVNDLKQFFARTGTANKTGDNGGQTG